MSPEVHTLTGAYALDALPDGERTVFEDHLEVCAACQRELAELRETAARLGAAVAATPPQRLRADVLAAAREVRQLPPDEGSIIPIRGRRWPLRVAVAAAAACLAAAIALGVQVVRTDERLDVADRQRAELSSVLAASDARVVVGDDATVVVSAQRGKLVFVPQGLRPAGPEKTHQLWLIGPDGARSAGLLGRTPVVRATDPGATKLGVTIEPRGGSPQPTSDPILLLTLPR